MWDSLGPGALPRKRHFPNTVRSHPRHSLPPIELSESAGDCSRVEAGLLRLRHGLHQRRDGACAAALVERLQRREHVDFDLGAQWTVRDMTMPPAGASASRRAAMFTPSP